jgi:hypothetical protein
MGQIIGLCGLIGSGKGTVADILVKNYNFTKISFADKLKDAVAVMFGWDRQMLEGDTVESRVWREEVDFFWTREMGEEITPRLVLQKFGTECMREGFYDEIWVSFVKKELLLRRNQNFVIPDVRFVNEIKMINGMGGKVWRVKRGVDPGWFRRYITKNIIPNNIHPSEWNWATSKMDYVLPNNGDVEHLKLHLESNLLVSI